jgi:protein-S-isoprenylcysteine O-methyltransferase Ste14
MPSLYENPLLIRYGNFMFRYRNRAFPILFVLIALAFPPTAEISGRADLWLDVAALAVALSGELLRILTVGLEYIKRGGLNKQVYADHLVTEGLFAHCHNPLYVGNVMIAVALFTILDRIEAFVVGGALFTLTYIAIVAAEERYLHAKFGAVYEAYCRHTNRWIPDLRGIRATVSGMRFNWRRVLLKESTSFYGWVVAAFVLDGLENRFVLTNADLAMFFTLLVVSTVAFVTIRVLKKTHRLHL